MMQIGNQAAQGELRAARELFSLVQRSEDAVNSEMTPLSPHEMDQRVMETIRRRMESVKAETLSANETTSKEESQ